MLPVISLISLVVVNASYNANFDTDWQTNVLNTGAANAAFATYGDSSDSCKVQALSGSGSSANTNTANSANTQQCMVQISQTLQTISQNYQLINTALGDSGTMTNWFLAGTGQNPQSLSKMQQNVNYLSQALTTMSTLIGGQQAQVNSLLGAPANTYLSFGAAVDATTANLFTIGNYATTLGSLVNTANGPFLSAINSLSSNMAGILKALNDDNLTVQQKTQQSYDFYKSLATTVVTNFAGNLTALNAMQQAQGGYVSNVTAAINAVNQNFQTDWNVVKKWNLDQSSFIATINNAIKEANSSLGATMAKEYQIALASEAVKLTTDVINQAVLNFNALQQQYTTQQSSLIQAAQTNITNLTAYAQTVINAKAENLSSTVDYYKDFMANMTSNIINIASSALTSANDTLIVASASQQTWQTQMSGVLSNIAQALNGVGTAAAARDAQSQSLASEVLMKFDTMISTLQQSALKYASQNGDVLSQGSNLTAGVQSDTTTSVNSANDAAFQAGSQASNGQMAVISRSAIQMMSGLADLLLSLHGLMSLLQAQMGSAADSSNGALQLVNEVVSGSAQDLAMTISDISTKHQSDLVGAQVSGMQVASDASGQLSNTVGGVGAQAWAVVSRAQDMYGDAADSSNTQINALANQIQSASTASAQIKSANSAIASGASNAVQNIQVNAAQLRTMLSNAQAAMQVAFKGTQASAMAGLDTLNHTLMSQLTNTASQTNTSVLSLYSAYSDYLNTVNNSILSVPDASTLSVGTVGLSMGQLSPLLAGVVSSFETESGSVKTAIDANLSSAVNNFTSIESAAEQADMASIAAMVSMMTNVTLVPNIADVQTASLTKFSQAISSAYGTLGDISSAASDENRIFIQAKALNESVSQRLASLQTYLADHQAEADNASATALQEVQNESQVGFNASKDLDALILSTQLQMNDLNSTILANIANTTVAVDVGPVIDRMNAFLASVQDQQASFFSATAQQAAGRASLITQQQAGVQLLRAKEEIKLISGKADYASNQGTTLKVADQLATVLGDLAALSGQNVSALLSNLASIKTISANLGNSMQDYVTSAASRMEAETALTAQKLKQLATNNIMTRALSVKTTANKVLSAMDSFEATSDSLGSLASANSVGIAELSSMVAELDSSASIQLQLLLNDVQSGRISLQAALQGASNLSSEQLSTTSGVATELAVIVNTYLANSAEVFSGAQELLSDFNVSASETLTDYASGLNDALNSVQALVDLGRTVSDSLAVELKGSIVSVGKSLAQERAIDRNEALAVSNSTSFISSFINNVTSEYEGIEKSENEAIASLTQWAQLNIHRLISRLAANKTKLNVDALTLAWAQ